MGRIPAALTDRHDGAGRAKGPSGPAGFARLNEHAVVDTLPCPSQNRKPKSTADRVRARSPALNSESGASTSNKLCQPVGNPGPIQRTTSAIAHAVNGTGMTHASQIGAGGIFRRRKSSRAKPVRAAKTSGNPARKYRPRQISSNKRERLITDASKSNGSVTTITLARPVSATGMTRLNLRRQISKGTERSAGTPR